MVTTPKEPAASNESPTNHTRLYVKRPSRPLNGPQTPQIPKVPPARNYPKSNSPAENYPESRLEKNAFHGKRRNKQTYYPETIRRIGVFFSMQTYYPEMFPATYTRSRLYMYIFDVLDISQTS